MGARENLNGRKNVARGKVKKDEKSPWGQCLTRPVPNGRRRSIKLCMETPCLCPFQGHKYGRRKPTETSVFAFSYLCMNSSLEELIKIKAIFILRQGMFR